MIRKREGYFSCLTVEDRTDDSVGQTVDMVHPVAEWWMELQKGSRARDSWGGADRLSGGLKQLQGTLSPALKRPRFSALSSPLSLQHCWAPGLGNRSPGWCEHRPAVSEGRIEVWTVRGAPALQINGPWQYLLSVERAVWHHGKATFHELWEAVEIGWCPRRLEESWCWLDLQEGFKGGSRKW